MGDVTTSVLLLLMPTLWGWTRRAALVPPRLEPGLLTWGFQKNLVTRSPQNGVLYHSGSPVCGTPIYTCCRLNSFRVRCVGVSDITTGVRFTLLKLLRCLQICDLAEASDDIWGVKRTPRRL